MRTGRKVWTKIDVENLVTWTLDGVGPHELARRLRCATVTLRKMQIELQLINETKLRRRWNKEELDLIRERYADASTAELARLLARPVYSVYNAAEKLGLSKSAEYLASPAACRLRRGDEVGKEFRFRPGIIPHNKGKRSPGLATGRMGETQFRKGSLPTNTMALGSTRLIDGYLYRKISEIRNVPHTRNWKLEHYLIWEKENGPIPNGHALVFIDGNRANVVLDNLELITRADLARRNTIHKLPEDLKEVIRLNASIKRRIRKIDAQKQDDGSQESPFRDTRSA